MAFRFSILASGSSGNAAFLESDGFGLLIDAGLGPRQLASRLAAVGASWAKVNAVLLTHTHTDHWKDRTLKHLRQLHIPFYCHAGHHGLLREFGPAFVELLSADLVRCYESEKVLHLGPSLRCRPLDVRHDSYPTFGFRIEGHDGLFGPSWAVGYAADLGCWSAELVEQLANVDVLALEFNHDEEMERSSRRPPELVERVLGDEGHLSNAQAAELLRLIMDRSDPGVIRHVIQLHLSRECNRTMLAQAAAHAVTNGAITIHTAEQERVGPVLTLDVSSRSRGQRVMPRPVTTANAHRVQQCLPGMAE
jgi:phosphoribosyl 1,2-cyclic phosphodiesterase